MNIWVALERTTLRNGTTITFEIGENVVWICVKFKKLKVLVFNFWALMHIIVNNELSMFKSDFFFTTKHS